MNIQDKIKDLIKKALIDLGTPKEMVTIQIEHPTDLALGDYSSNVALILSKQLGATAKNPVDLAKKIAEHIKKEKKDFIKDIQVAGPGFINFFLSRDFFVDSVAEILKKDATYGKNTKHWKEKVLIEYTDPNPFKEFHIGHLMSNTIGESLSRLIEWSGAKVARANYQGDVGLHVAKALWAMTKELPKPDATPLHQAEYLGKMYSQGAKVYDEDEKAKKEIIEINKKIYNRSDKKINELYDWGRKASLDYFEIVYKKLGTDHGAGKAFNYYFFESETGAYGKKVVEEHLKDGVFEKSDNAIVFRGEKYDPALHTRVFINSEGLPTYEAKELGLAKIKYDEYSYTTSIVVTGNEVNDYFKVLLKAMSLVFPELAEKTKHVSHGMLRLPTGKMSSRTGDVITAESLIEEVQNLILEKIKDREFTEAQKKEISETVAIGAIKYSILKQSVGKDIIFDFDKSLSFEGDSGPYLQYVYVRAKSILKKAKEEGIKPQVKKSPEEISDVERMLYRFPEIVERASDDYAPQAIATYLVHLAGLFNTYYAQTKIVNKEDESSAYKVALAEAVSWVIKNGLDILGIKAPERM